MGCGMQGSKDKKPSRDKRRYGIFIALQNERDLKKFSDSDLISDAIAIAEAKDDRLNPEQVSDLLNRIVSNLSHKASVLTGKKGFYEYVLPLLPMPENPSEHPLVKMTRYSSKGSWKVIDDIYQHFPAEKEAEKKGLLKELLKARVAQKHFAYIKGDRGDRIQKFPAILTYLQDPELNESIFWEYSYTGTVPNDIGRSIFTQRNSALQIYNKVKDSPRKLKALLAVDRNISNSIYSHLDDEGKKEFITNPLVGPMDALWGRDHKRLADVNNNEVRSVLDKLAKDRNFNVLSIEVKTSIVERFLVRSTHLEAFLQHVHSSCLNQEIKNAVLENQIGKEGKKPDRAVIKAIKTWGGVTPRMKTGLAESLHTLNSTGRAELLDKLLTNKAFDVDLCHDIFEEFKDKQELIEAFNTAKGRGNIVEFVDEAFARIDEATTALQYLRAMDKELVAKLLHSKNEAIQYVVEQVDREKNATFKKLENWLEGKSTNEQLLALFELYKVANTGSRSAIENYYNQQLAINRSLKASRTDPKVLSDFYLWAKNAKGEVDEEKGKDKEKDPKDLLNLDFKFLFELKKIYDAREEAIRNATATIQEVIFGTEKIYRYQVSGEAPKLSEHIREMMEEFESKLKKERKQRGLNSLEEDERHIMGRDSRIILFKSWVSGLFTAAKKAEDPRIQELAEKFDAAVTLRDTVAGENHGGKTKQNNLGNEGRKVLRDSFLIGNELGSLDGYHKLNPVQQALVMEISLRYAISNGQSFKVQQILTKAFNKTNEVGIKKAAFRAIHRYKDVEALAHYLNNIDEPSDALNYLNESRLMGFSDKQLMDYAVLTAKFFQDKEVDEAELGKLMTKFLSAMTQSSIVLKDKPDFYKYVLPLVPMPDEPMQHPLVKMTFYNSKGAWKVMDNVVKHSEFPAEKATQKNELLKTMVIVRVDQQSLSTSEPGENLISILKSAKNPKLNAEVFIAMLEKREAFIKASDIKRLERSGYDNVMLHILKDKSSVEKLQKQINLVDLDLYTKVKDEHGHKHSISHLARNTLKEAAKSPDSWASRMGATSRAEYPGRG
ncbi:MAG: hypothetical protein K0R73_1124 [Candidatus Midichloriaceae bacterium]|jgi:hypothetical protein|nr:hypothetical protein [Candidatus Midichloriaceae bacterium]